MLPATGRHRPTHRLIYIFPAESFRWLTLPGRAVVAASSGQCAHSALGTLRPPPPPLDPLGCALASASKVRDARPPAARRATAPPRHRAAAARRRSSSCSSSSSMAEARSSQKSTFQRADKMLFNVCLLSNNYQLNINIARRSFVRSFGTRIPDGQPSVLGRSLCGDWQPSDAAAAVAAAVIAAVIAAVSPADVLAPLRSYVLYRMIWAMARRSSQRHGPRSSRMYV